MNVALASLVVATAMGLPQRPIDFSASIAAPRHIQPLQEVAGLRVDAELRRPTILPLLYGTYATFQALDVWSSGRAVTAGAREANPTLATISGNRLALTSIKVVTAGTTIYFVDRLWRRNRTGAVVLMAALNGVSALVVSHNIRVANRAEVGR